MNDLIAGLSADYVRGPIGLILPEAVAKKRYCRRLPTGIDLFAGAGGFSLGFKQAGFEIVAANEWDCCAAQTYMVNLCRYGEVKIHFVEDSDGERFEKHLSKQYKKISIDNPFPVVGSGWISSHPNIPGTKHFFLGDVRKLTGERILKETGYARGEIDCVTGGPPCQGFSTAGKRNVMDPRNSLVFDFARMVLEIWPKTMVFENVPGIVNMLTPDGVPVVDAIGRILEDGDFMTLDALKKMIVAQTGAVCGLQKKFSKKTLKAKRAASHADRQPSLFETENEPEQQDENENEGWEE